MDNLEQVEQEENLPSQPQPSSKKKYLLIGIIVTVIVVGGIFLVLGRIFLPETTPPFGPGDPVPAREQISSPIIPADSVSEGTLLIKENQTLTFPSGATLELTNNRLYFSNETDAPREERLTFNRKLEVYVNGYTHTFEDVKCEEETRFFGDYWDSVVIQCDMQSSIILDEKPSILSYDGVSADFSSVPSKSVSRFKTLQEKPWIAVWVPYFQIADSSPGYVVNVVSPREDVVSIYTNYGRADFQFDAGELDNLQQKTVKVGPVTISLSPLELTCAETYRVADGSCYTLDWKGTSTTTYNVVNFRITIKEESFSIDYPLLIDIEK
ncbi:hypothetical protein IID24_01720 [Patescibacteria group bacterium]|nr:hypothetical protein [Patescibacteria group bacterium]